RKADSQEQGRRRGTRGGVRQQGIEDARERVRADDAVDRDLKRQRDEQRERRRQQAERQDAPEVGPVRAGLAQEAPVERQIGGGAPHAAPVPPWPWPSACRKAAVARADSTKIRRPRVAAAAPRIAVTAQAPSSPAAAASPASSTDEPIPTMEHRGQARSRTSCWPPP